MDFLSIKISCGLIFCYQAARVFDQFLLKDVLILLEDHRKTCLVIIIGARKIIHSQGKESTTCKNKV